MRSTLDARDGFRELGADRRQTLIFRLLPPILLARKPAARTSDQVALTMDLTASILAATGTKAPDSYHPDGMDILPILRGEAPVVARQVFWRGARPVHRVQSDPDAGSCSSRGTSSCCSILAMTLANTPISRPSIRIRARRSDGCTPNGRIRCDVRRRVRLRRGDVGSLATLRRRVVRGPVAERVVQPFDVAGLHGPARGTAS